MTRRTKVWRAEGSICTIVVENEVVFVMITIYVLAVHAKRRYSPRATGFTAPNPQNGQPWQPPGRSDSHPERVIRVS